MLVNKFKKFIKKLLKHLPKISYSLIRFAIFPFFAKSRFINGFIR